jgi:transposase-like protein
MNREEKRREMEDLIEQWKESGKTQKDFAKEHDIRLSKLRYWIRKSREEREPEGFLSFSLPGENSIRLLYPNGIELQMPAGTPVSVIRSLLNL